MLSRTWLWPTILPIIAAALIGLSSPVARAQCVSGWGGLNQTTFGFVNALALWDPDGPGPQEPMLVAGGNQLLSSTQYVAAWDGTTWSGFGAGENGAVYSLAGLPNGDLVAGGTFTTAGGVTAIHIARWDGTAWNAMPGLPNNAGDRVEALAVLPNGDIMAGGIIGGVFSNIAHWDGSTWTRPGAGLGGEVFALAALSNGDVIAGGTFTTAGGVSVGHIARWNGAAWSAIGSGGPNVVRAIAVFPNGDIAAGGGGGFPVYRWNGSSWLALGGSMDGVIKTLTIMANGNLVAGGVFTMIGVMSAPTLGRWDGSDWYAMGATSGTYALLPRAGGELVVGGNFTVAGGVSAHNLAHCYFAPLPVLVTGPSTTSLCGPGPAAFSVETTGSGLTYQWQIATGANGPWQSLADNPATLVCGGSAYASPHSADHVNIGVVPCPGTNHYEIRCVVSNACGDSTFGQATLVLNSADFDGDGDVGTDSDIEAFFACLAGSCCPSCGTADFNGDGDVGTDADIESFFRILAGGAC
jgi:hypothetical protein